LIAIFREIYSETQEQIAEQKILGNLKFGQKRSMCKVVSRKVWLLKRPVLLKRSQQLFIRIIGKMLSESISGICKTLLISTSRI
jgi:hypothetical protein